MVAQTGAVLHLKNPNLLIVVPPGCVGKLLCQTLVMIELETNDVLSLPKSKVFSFEETFSRTNDCFGIASLSDYCNCSDDTCCAGQHGCIEKRGFANDYEQSVYSESSGYSK